MYVHAGGLRNVWFGTAERGCDDNIITTWNPDPSTSDFAMKPVTFLCEKFEGISKNVQKNLKFFEEDFK